MQFQNQYRIVMLLAIFVFESSCFAQDSLTFSKYLNGQLVSQQTVTGTSMSLGPQLKDILENQLTLADYFHIGPTYAASPVVVYVKDVSVDVNNIELSFGPGLQLVAPEDTAYQHVMKFVGDNCTIYGLSVDGNGRANLNFGGRGEGINLTGNDCFLTKCTASNTPNTRTGNCFSVSGENSVLTRCTAKNPGYACFRNNANIATYHEIFAEVTDNYYDDDEGTCRLFALDLTQKSEAGLVTISDSIFYADFGAFSSLPPQARGVFLNFDPGNDPNLGLDALQMTDSTIFFGQGVTSFGSNHIMKVTNVLRTEFTRVAIGTPGDYWGSALRVQREDPLVTMQIDIDECWWDQGINFDSPVEEVNVSNSTIGKVGSKSHELLNDINFVKQLRIANSSLSHCAALAGLRPDNSDCHFEMIDSTFTSSVIYPNTHIFRCNVPLRASFYSAENVGYYRSISSHPNNNLFLSYSPSARLACTSNDLVSQTMLFDPSLGVSSSLVSPTNSTMVFGPPFTGMPGQSGDRIYLRDGADPSANGWQDANYWAWNSVSSSWVPDLSP